MSGRRLSASLAGLGTVLLLAGCGLSGTAGNDAGTPSADGKITGEVTLQTWNLKSGFSDYIEGVIAGFEKAYPGTKVKWIDQPGEGYEDKLLTQASAGELPDVTNTTPAFAYQLAKQGLIEDLSGLDDTIDATYVAGAVDGFRFPGLDGTFGYPWYLSSELNYWNTSILTKAGIGTADLPTDTDGLVAAARKVKAATHGDSYLMSIKPTVGTLASAGVPIINDDGTKFLFNTDEAVALVDTYRAAYAEGLLPEAVLTDKLGSSNDLFTKGTAGWTTSGGNFPATVIENNPSLKDKIGTSEHFGTAPLDVQGVSVPKSSKNLPTAVALARYLTDAENQEAFATLVPGIFPSTSSSQTSAFATSDGTATGDAMAIAFAGLADARVLEPPQLSAAMSTIVNQQISAAVTGKKTSREALDTAVAKCDDLLNQ